MSQKERKTTIYDPIQGTLITCDYETTLRTIREFLLENLQYDSAGKVKGLPTYIVSKNEKAKAALDRLLKNLKADPPVDFYKIIAALVAFPGIARAGGWFGSDKLADYVEAIIKTKLPLHIVFYAFDYLNRSKAKVDLELRRLTSQNETLRSANARERRERADLNATFRHYQEYTMNATRGAGFKGTVGHELNKLKACVSQFRLTAVNHLQVALSNKAIAGNVSSAQLIAEVQFMLLKDVLHTKGSSIIVQSVMSALTFGIPLLEGKVLTDDETHKTVLSGLLNFLKDPKCETTIEALFNSTKKENEGNKELVQILDKTYQDWKALIPGLSVYSPKDICILSKLIHASLKPAMGSGAEVVPKRLNMGEVPAAKFIDTLFKVVVSIKQIYEQNIFFEVEDQEAFDNLRTAHTKFFQDLEEFMRTAIRAASEDEDKRELSELDGYNPEFKDILEEPYNNLWKQKEEEKALKERVAAMDASAIFK